ncbi:glutamate--cysteine ligase [Natronorubrum daqingense]|uniref:Glutamate--cysteine ligase n=1 Tax=Natronorubrum daqingense TaxID=588898 RepID=A0A1N7DQL5_9EURY|nr:glutamate--cysteine ligase [Natronorubrum daqingense]APX96114.1 carboxylate--amine ligase [Natronorubrum daqingense]SIR78137.1 carboxylate-amine ligase [Natronorubrum daqingense]
MERGSRESFTRMGTLGIEEECFVVDDDGRPTSGTDELVYEHDPPEILDDRLDHELFKFVIETQTPLIEEPSDARESLLEIRRALVDHANEHGFQIAAAGLHPLAKWRELEHAEKPRYQSQLDRIQYPQHRNTTAGVHVHVGVDDADKAVWIANELRWYVPIMLALSANSPYWNGFDTGLQSARAKIFEALPNTGMPTYFEDYEAFDQFERRMLETNAIEDRGELWYDVRPHTAHGTVELRTPDGQADPDIVMAFVEYAHALVEALAAEYEDGAPGYGREHRRELLDENKWRAIRHGQDASFITRDLEGTVDLGEVVDRECERLGIEGIKRVYERESGAERQRRLREEDGPDALCQSLLLGTE